MASLLREHQSGQAVDHVILEARGPREQRGSGSELGQAARAYPTAAASGRRLG